MTQHRIPQHMPDAASVAALLEELARVPAHMTPGDTRAALAEAIRTGEVDALYQPLGSPHWNVCLVDLPPEIDPRVRLDRWVELWQTGQNAAEAVISAYTVQQARIWQAERQRLQDGGQPR